MSYKIESEGQISKQPNKSEYINNMMSCKEVSKAQATKAMKIKVIQKILSLLCIPLMQEICHFADQGAVQLRILGVRKAPKFL